MTQILARYTHLLDGRKTVKMTGRVYVRAILPIGLFFSLSLICGNMAYLSLEVAFIQMLKVGTPPRSRDTRIRASWLTQYSLPVGHHSRSRPPERLGHGPCPTQRQGPAQRLGNRVWRDSRHARRGQ